MIFRLAECKKNFAPKAESAVLDTLIYDNTKTGMVKISRTGYLHKTSFLLTIKWHYGNYDVNINVIMQRYFRRVLEMKRVALINDLSGFGKCSLTAAIPVISVMGIQACPVPTAILTAQTGFGEFFCDDFTDRMDYFTEQWKEMEVSFDGIYSGYLASPSQIEKVMHFLEQFQEKDTLYLADPVMGDQGKFYSMVSAEFLEGMRKLSQMADVITPNLTELCFLSGVDYGSVIACRQKENYIDKIKSLCEKILSKAKKPQTVIVTGILSEKEKMDYIGNLAVSREQCFYIETPYTGMGFSGTGDLFASVICGSLIKGLSIQEAVEKATYFLQEAIEEATKEKIPRNHGVNFEKYLSRLL